MLASRTAALVALLLLPACVGVRVPEPADLSGRWRMVSAERDGQDLTAQANPDGDRTIALWPDGSFIATGGGTDGDNRGRWHYVPNTQRIVLDSDLGPDADSDWTVTMVGRDRMRWDGEVGGASLVIVSVRAGDVRPRGPRR